ncbi:MAG: Uma2 family endonuclease [Streptomyces sp.]|nr:Uma2 family endonuclease [Streptomyces sp.]
MVAVALDPITQKLLLDWFVDLGTPEGLRAELIEGELVVTPLPDGHQEHCVSRIVGQLYRRSSEEVHFSANKGLRLRGADGCPEDHVIPDGTFVAGVSRPFRGAEPWMACEEVAMVLEVTARTPQMDREIKRRCYARAGIPLYLLSSPGGDDYRKLDAASFGDSIALPAPFSFDLETMDFL